MTNNEIIKALECCLICADVFVCETQCPFYKKCKSSEELVDYVIALINRQKAEIERLQAEYTRACAERDARICTADFFKAEAIKEFAKMLIDKSENGVIHISDLPDYVKETLGEGSNSPLVDNQN